MPIGKLVEDSKKASSSSDTILLTDYGKTTIARMLPAYINATLRFADGCARSRSMQAEMLLLISGTMNIGKALQKCGAKSNAKFLVFSSSRKAFVKFSRSSRITKQETVPLSLDVRTSGSVAMAELLND